MKAIYFIVNPQAGNGHCMNVWTSVEKELKVRNVDYHAFFTSFPGHARELAEIISKKNLHQTIFLNAVGGDGTLHEVINGAAAYKNSTIGFIPGGSGNDFSRGFHIPKEPIEALSFLLKSLHNNPKQIDFGRILDHKTSEHYFINNMGVGFDALISYEVNHSRMKGLLNKLSMGRLVYVYYLLKKLFTYRCTTIDLTIDGKSMSFKDTWFVTVSNQPYYGGGMKIAPDAQADDGLFNITIVHQLSRLKLLLVFMSVFWGKHIFFKEVKTFKGKLINIQSSKEVFAHADGEHIGYTPLMVQVQEKALSITAKQTNNHESGWEEMKSNGGH